MEASIRVLVANRPRLLRELVLSTLSEQAGISVVGEAHDERDVPSLVEQTRPDFLLFRAKQEEVCQRFELRSDRNGGCCRRPISAGRAFRRRAQKRNRLAQRRSRCGCHGRNLRVEICAGGGMHFSAICRDCHFRPARYFTGRKSASSPRPTSNLGLRARWYLPARAAP
jgi:hypothetical protein